MLALPLRRRTRRTVQTRHARGQTGGPSGLARGSGQESGSEEDGASTLGDGSWGLGGAPGQDVEEGEPWAGSRG